MDYGKAGLKEYKNLMGINYVRPPLLNFDKVKETKDYTEYKVKTHKDALLEAESSDDVDGVFSNDIDSLIYCNETLNLKVPKPSYMKKSGKAKFAYAFGMFPNPKNGKAAYLDGCILGALGLKRQKTHADVICFITPDISEADKRKLEVVFDKVIYVPYISPYKMTGTGNLKTIMMDPDIFKNCPNYTKEHPYAHVFFKLHIFNPKLFPYEKVCFVDSDLVPMNYYDSLFMLDTPAGWVEYRKKWPYQRSFHWDRCDYLEHGKPIPKIFTETGTKGASDVNAGLMIISPNQKEYDTMIKQLQSPAKTWLGPGKEHIGFWDMDLNKETSITGQKFVDSSYCYPEQNYLTKRYSGQWTYVEYSFQSWSLDPCNSFGIHMAAFNPKPWFKQPANSEIKVREDYHPYFDEAMKEIFVSEIPKAVVPEDESLILENISISYELFNDLIIWGLVEYPKLHKFFMHDTKIHGTKLSFGEDKFKPLSKRDEFKLLKDITQSDPDYKKLSISQQYISNLMNNYQGFVKKVKDKYLSVCKTKLEDRYGEYNYDFTIIDYPGHIDKSLSEKKQLLKHGKISFGKFRGTSINDLPEEEAIFYVKSREFATDSELREAFAKSKYHHLVNLANLASLKKKKKTQKRSRTRKNKRKTTKKRVKTELHYFRMDGCGWCDEFQETLWPQVTNIQGLKTKIINGPENINLAKKYKIQTYPSLVRVTNGRHKLFKGKRTMNNILKFLK